MPDLTKLYTRIPKRVYALQWFPYSVLPNVENSFVEVTISQPQAPFTPEDLLKNQDISNYFNTLPKTTKICISATATMVNGEKMPVDPTNWVLYSETNKQPIAVVTDTAFNDVYVDADKFDLCPACFAKSLNVKSGVPNAKSIAEIIAIINSGRAVTLDGQTINTVEGVKEWFAARGVPT